MYIVFVSTWSLLGVKKKLGPCPDRFPLGVLLKISDEHPHPLHMWNSPPPPGSGYTKPIYKTRYGAFWLLNFVTFASHSDTVLSRYNVGVNKVSLIQYTHEYSTGQREMTTLWLSHLCYDSKFWLNLLVQRCSYDSDCVCDSDSVVCANYIRTKKGLKLN